MGGECAGASGGCQFINGQLFSHPLFHSPRRCTSRPRSILLALSTPNGTLSLLYRIPSSVPSTQYFYKSHTPASHTNKGAGIQLLPYKSISRPLVPIVSLHPRNFHTLSPQSFPTARTTNTSSSGPRQDRTTNQLDSAKPTSTRPQPIALPQLAQYLSRLTHQHTQPADADVPTPRQLPDTAYPNISLPSLFDTKNTTDQLHTRAH